MMTKLEERLIKSILTLLYEPDIHDGTEKYGDYGGFTVERRSCLKVPNDEDPYNPMDNGYELFITTINDLKYIVLYRTWIDDEYGGHDGRVEALIKVDFFDAKYATHRLTEVSRLIKKFDYLLSQLEER